MLVNIIFQPGIFFSQAYIALLQRKVFVDVRPMAEDIAANSICRINNNSSLVIGAVDNNIKSTYFQDQEKEKEIMT